MVLVIPVLFWHKAPKRFLLPNAIFRGRTAPTAVSAALGSACPIHNLGPHQPVSASRPHLVSSFQLHQCQHSRMRTPGPRLAVPLTGCCVKSVITVSVGPTNWPISTYAAPNQPQLVHCLPAVHHGTRTELVFTKQDSQRPKSFYEQTLTSSSKTMQNRALAGSSRLQEKTFHPHQQSGCRVIKDNLRIRQPAQREYFLYLLRRLSLPYSNTPWLSEAGSGSQRLSPTQVKRQHETPSEDSKLLNT